MVRTCLLRRWRPRLIASRTTPSRRRPFHQRRRSSSIGAGVGSGQEDDASSILFLSPSNWPEPHATAAGTRTMSLLDHFSSPQSKFGSVHFGCGAKMPSSMGKAHDAEGRAMHWHEIKPNREDDMKRLLQRIHDNHGPIRAVVFDRFYAEEAYSFRIRELCPDAALVLDMQDVHSLRAGRRCLVEEIDGQRAEEPAGDGVCKLTKELMEQVMAFDPSSHPLLTDEDRSKAGAKAYDMFLRELASIHRSDVVLVCSSVETRLLESWNVPSWKLVPASFFCTKEDASSSINGNRHHTFDDRQDFVTVGGFKHAPNVDSVQALRYDLWPRIRKRLPRARMHVYGAYPTRQILSMHDESLGFLVHGHVQDLDAVLSCSRVLLAPLRFGAGIKGKIVDAWRCGCPVVTTPVGAEGMMDEDASGSDAVDEMQSATENCASWGGVVATDAEEFADAAVEVYTQRHLWDECQAKGASLLRSLFSGRVNLPVVERGICDAMANLKQRRRLDYLGAMLWRDSQRSTEYFSRWIELKERQ